MLSFTHTKILYLQTIESVGLTAVRKQCW